MVEPALSRKERRALAAARRLLGPGMDVRAYASGRAQARMTGPAVALVAAFCAVFVLAAVLRGVVLVPSVLVLLLLALLVCPVRGMAVTQSGIVQLAVGSWRGLARRQIATLPYWVLWPPYTTRHGRRVRVQLAGDVVTLRRRDYERLVSAVSSSGGYWPTAPAHAYGHV